MASNSNSLNVSQPQIPVFNGDSGSGDDAQKKENAKRDAKALFFIQQAVDNSIFSRIAAASTANQAWTILKTEYQGSTKVITVKLQSLRRNFETASMKGNESVQEYLAKVSSIVSQMRSYGEKITDETIVAKVLRSLHPKFDHVVAAIEESKDLSVFSFDELTGSLQAHEARINRNTDKEEEKAFQIRGEPETSNQRLRGRGRSSFEAVAEMKANGSCVADTWYVDSACLHHITGDKSKFKDFDETIRSHVTLGDDKRLSVEGRGRGTAMVNVGDKKKYIKDVNYASGLAHNLVSVGQLLESSYSVLFDDAKCLIRNKATGEILASAHMTSNRMFPLDFSEDSIMMSKTSEESELWHLRYGHLNTKGLQLLKSKEMVYNLPTITPSTQICEGCVLGKQAKKSFPVGKSRRATGVLEHMLIYVVL
ncbi:retrovirus-related pol polyprotein from transposon TNT 1-94 [Tanacetum coccineum]